MLAKFVCFSCQIEYGITFILCEVFTLGTLRYEINHTDSPDTTYKHILVPYVSHVYSVFLCSTTSNDGLFRCRMRDLPAFAHALSQFFFNGPEA